MLKVVAEILDFYFTEAGPSKCEHTKEPIPESVVLYCSSRHNGTKFLAKLWGDDVYKAGPLHRRQGVMLEIKTKVVGQIDEMFPSVNIMFFATNPQPANIKPAN